MYNWDDHDGPQHADRARRPRWHWFRTIVELEEALVCSITLSFCKPPDPLSSMLKNKKKRSIIPHACTRASSRIVAVGACVPFACLRTRGTPCTPDVLRDVHDMAQLGQELAATVREQWPGVIATPNFTASSITGYTGTHYIVRSNTKSVFLKVYPSREAEAVVKLQTEVLRYLKVEGRLRSNKYFATPELIPGAANAGYVVASIGPNVIGIVVAYEFSEGVCLHDAIAQQSILPEALVAAFGTAVGRLDKTCSCFKAASNTRVPAAHINNATDLHAVSLSASVEKSIWDIASCRDHIEGLSHLEGKRLQHARTALLAELDVDSTGVTYSWIHGDANDLNVIVSPSASVSLVDITPEALTFIDWDDVVYTRLYYEAAIALAYLLLGRADPIATGAAFLEAYCSQMPLNHKEASLILDAIRKRLAVSLVMSAKSAKSSPDRAEYILVHSQAAAQLLAWTYGDDAESGSASFDPSSLDGADACKRREAEIQSAWCSAAAKASAIAQATGRNVYVPHRLADLSREQVRTSEAVIAGLRRMGRDRQLGPVVAVPVPATARGDSSGASVSGKPAVGVDLPHGKAGEIPNVRHWGAAGDADDVAWPSVPFVYDFSGRSNADLGDVVGTDPVKLRAFTDMMFEPLLDGEGDRSPAADAAAESASSSADASSSSSTGPAYAAQYGRSQRRLARLGWGRYMEDRILYQSEHFTGGSDKAGASADADADASGAAGASAAAPAAPAQEARTLHLGVDLEAPPCTPVYAPLDGVVHSWARNTQDLDYGPTVVLRHEIEVEEGEMGQDEVCSSGSGAEAKAAKPKRRVVFYSLYGHLTLSTIYSGLAHTDGPSHLDAALNSPLEHVPVRPRFTVGQRVPKGGVVGWIGDSDVNGGWPPHVHFQIQTEINMGGWIGDYPGVCAKSSADAYALLTPDPNLVLRCPWVAPVGWPPDA